jgi:hypothetical protein
VNFTLVASSLTSVDGVDATRSLIFLAMSIVGQVQHQPGARIEALYRKRMARKCQEKTLTGSPDRASRLVFGKETCRGPARPPLQLVTHKRLTAAIGTSRLTQ